MHCQYIPASCSILGQKTASSTSGWIGVYLLAPSKPTLRTCSWRRAPRGGRGAARARARRSLHHPPAAHWWLLLGRLGARRHLSFPKVPKVNKTHTCTQVLHDLLLPSHISPCALRSQRLQWQGHMQALIVSAEAGGSAGANSVESELGVTAGARAELHVQARTAGAGGGGAGAVSGGASCTERQRQA